MKKIVIPILNKFLYIIAVFVSIIFLLFIISLTWINYDVRNTCQDAKDEYGGTCIKALSNLVNDEKRSYKVRNSAIWALGQIADNRALPVLKKHYTGIIPNREPLDKMISQYELKKAIKWCNEGNGTSWMYGDLVDSH